MKTLSDESIQKQFVKSCMKYWKSWDKLDRIKRLASLDAAINEAIESVPFSKVLFISSTNTINAQFDYKKWAIQINTKVISEKFDPSAFIELCSFTYHEARHAEQFFLMAMRASAVYKKNDNRAITLLPKEIGDAAIKMAASYPKNRDKEIGQWFISLLGYKQDETTKVIKEVTDLIKGHNASKDAYQKYRNLVHEADAFAITSAIRLKMKSEFSTLNEDETFAGLQELFTDKD